MNLMGDYAAANHEVIHKSVAKIAGPQDRLDRWRTTTTSPGRKSTTAARSSVHRKGATPAGEGVLGVIPGSMATPGYVVRGRGEPASLRSGQPRRGPRDEPHPGPPHLPLGARQGGARKGQGRGAERRPSTRCRAFTRTSAPSWPPRRIWWTWWPASTRGSSRWPPPASGRRIERREAPDASPGLLHYPADANSDRRPVRAAWTRSVLGVARFERPSSRPSWPRW